MCQPLRNSRLAAYCSLLCLTIVYTTAARADLVFQAEELRATGYTDLHRALAELVPSLHAPSFSSQEGSDHAARLQVNGHAPDHLVVLVDGRRRHKSALLNLADAPGLGSVGPDVTTLPFGSIERVEVSLGSDNARHGGDALGAVINVILKGAGNGGSLTAQYGLNSGELRGIPDLLRVDTVGPDVVVSFSGDRNVDDGDGESIWLTGDWGFDVGERGYLRLSGEFRNQDATNRAGIDTRQQYPLNPDGTFDLRETTVERLNSHVGLVENQRVNVAANTRLALPYGMDFYGLLTIGTADNVSYAEFRRPLDERNISAIYPNGFLPEITSNVDDRGFVFGVRGDAWGWDFDVGFNIGENEVDLGVNNTLNASMGVLSPTRFSTGNNESREKHFTLEASRKLDWRWPLDVLLRVTQTEESFEIERGDAAAVIAGGARTDAGLLREPGAQGLGAFKIFKLDEGRDIYSMFGEVHAAPNRHSTLTLGAQYADYSDLGALFNANASGTYQFGDNGTLRATLALGEHAPALAQNVFTRTATRFDLADVGREAGILRPTDPAAMALGSSSLHGENISSLELGYRWQPRLEWNVDVSAYRTKLSDRVVLSDTLDLGSVPAGNPLVDALTAPGAGAIAEAGYFFNGPTVRNSGINLATDYRFQFETYGELQLALLANLNTTKVSGGNNAAVLENIGLDRFGASAVTRLKRGVPQNKVVATAIWQRQRFDALLRAVRYGKVTDATSGLKIDPTTLISLVFSYQASTKARLSFGVHNGFDEYPEVFSTQPGRPINNTLNPYSRYTPFGTDGRFVFLRLNADL